MDNSKYDKKYKARYLTDNQGNKKDVVISLKDFEELLEDIGNLAVIAERKNEKTISH